jgi:prevent-host-death family protein
MIYMAGKNHVSLTEAKQRLGELVKRAAYGGERFVLEFRDKPQAAIVSYEDLRRLEAQRGSTGDMWRALERLDVLRKRIATRTGKLPDSAQEIEEMREGRVDELQGLR